MRDYRGILCSHAARSTRRNLLTTTIVCKCILLTKASSVFHITSQIQNRPDLWTGWLFDSPRVNTGLGPPSGIWHHINWKNYKGLTPVKFVQLDGCKPSCFFREVCDCFWCCSCVLVCKWLRLKNMRKVTHPLDCCAKEIHVPAALNNFQTNHPQARVENLERPGWSHSSRHVTICQHMANQTCQFLWIIT